MIKVPVLLDHDYKRIIGFLNLDEKSFPTSMQFALYPGARIEYADDGKTIKSMEILEFSVCPIPSVKL